MGSYTAYGVFILASLFYLYEWLVQVSPSVMTNILMQEFHTDSAGLGLLASFFYWAYMPMQLVGGLMYDRFGPRRVLTAAIGICVTGAFFFSMTSNLFWADFSRFLMGFGAGCSFVGVLVLIARWFPVKQFALLAGTAQFLSSVGAIGGGTPLAHAIDTYGWRSAIFIVACLGVALAVGVWLVVRDYPADFDRSHEQNEHDQTFADIMMRLREVFQSRQTWLTVIYAYFIWAPFVIFPAMWGVVFFEKLYQFDTSQATNMISMIWLGVGFGSAFFGWWSDRFATRILPMAVPAVIGMVVSVIVLYVPNIPTSSMFIIMFLFGLAGAGQTVSFALIRDINKERNVGTAFGLNNMMVVAGGAVFHPLVGLLIHFFWNGAYQANGVPLYSVTAYQKSLFIIPLCFAIATIISVFFLEETHGRHIAEDDEPLLKARKVEQAPLEA